MDAPTRKSALEKLHAITNKIGYPSTWRSYDGLEVVRSSYLKCLIHASTFESHRELAKIGKPTNRNDLHLNGRLTLGENIADLGGAKLSHAAYRSGHPAVEKNGIWSDEQLFFIALAQDWCAKRRGAYERLHVITDPHSPPEDRVNGPLSNLPDFATAFSCGAGSKMQRQDRCAIW